MNIISTIPKKINYTALYASDRKYNKIFSKERLNIKHPSNGPENLAIKDKMLVNRFMLIHSGQYNSVIKLILQ